MSCVALAAVTAARTAPKKTILLDGAGSKFDPLIVSETPGCPLMGESDIIEGGCEKSGAQKMKHTTIIDSARFTISPSREVWRKPAKVPELRKFPKILEKQPRMSNEVTA